MHVMIIQEGNIKSLEYEINKIIKDLLHSRSLIERNFTIVRDVKISFRGDDCIAMIIFVDVEKK
jgi:hypothetical protein